MPTALCGCTVWHHRRMYENKSVPVDAPERFRVEILFSPGSNYNPFGAL